MNQTHPIKNRNEQTSEIPTSPDALDSLTYGDNELF